MSDSSNPLWFILPVATLNCIEGVRMWLHSRQVAEKNRQFIESGKETYFEQRRSWEAYGRTPPTDAESVRTQGRKLVVFNAVAITFGLMLWWFL
jgi:hypothetical protein